MKKLKIIANKLIKLAYTLDVNQIPSPPIDTIIDICNEKGLTTKQEIKEFLGLNKKDFYQLLTGQLAITKEVAKLLSNKVGSTPEFWMNRYKQYIDNLLKM